MKLKGLSQEEQIEKVAEIKALKMCVWWNLVEAGQVKEIGDGSELYMAILSAEQIGVSSASESMSLGKINDARGFEEWANAVNNIMSGGYAFVHPINHYPWCESGRINCFAYRLDDKIVATAAVINNGGVCSLEFVSTDKNYRRHGLAKAVCAGAMKDAFANGAKIITLRASEPGTRELYTTLGFEIYNRALDEF